MKQYIIIFIIAGLAGIMTKCSLDQSICLRLEILNLLSSKEERESKTVKKSLQWIFTALVFVSVYIAVWRLFSMVTDPINRARMLSVFIPVIGAGWIDYREKRIPNIFPCVLLLLGIFFLVLEFVFNRDAFQSYAVSCLLAFGATVVLLGIVTLIFRKGIGAGDIKLLSTLGLVGGVYTLCGTVVIGTTICAIVAIVLLLIKKKSLKSSLPYGPFIMIGYIATVIAGIY